MQQMGSAMYDGSPTEGSQRGENHRNFISVSVRDGRRSGCADNTSAADPPMSGQEKDVPLARPKEVVLRSVARKSETPRATTSGLMRPSAVGPQELKDAMFPLTSTAPTVRMFFASAGAL